MSTVAAIIVEGGRVFLGADSQAVEGGAITPGAVKWARFGPWRLGCAGYARYLDVAQLERGRLARMPWRPLEDPAADALEFAEELRLCLEARGLKHKEQDGAPPTFPGVAWLLAAPGALFTLHGTGCLSPVRPLEGRRHAAVAIGSGGDWARGAIEALFAADPHRPAAPVLAEAIAVASALDPFTGGPPHLATIDPEEEHP